MSIGSDRPGFNQIVRPDGTSEYVPNNGTFIDCRIESACFVGEDDCDPVGDGWTLGREIDCLLIAVTWVVFAFWIQCGA